MPGSLSATSLKLFARPAEPPDSLKKITVRSLLLAQSLLTTVCPSRAAGHQVAERGSMMIQLDLMLLSVAESSLVTLPAGTLQPATARISNLFLWVSYHHCHAHSLR